MAVFNHDVIENRSFGTYFGILPLTSVEVCFVW